jgi:hypothetical protein
MAKVELKTKKTDASVLAFLNSTDDAGKRADALLIHALMEKITSEKGKMWGASIVGYGSCHLKYASGRELDWMLTGFSPRKQNLTIYIMSGFDRYDELLGKLGKFKTGKSCLYVKKLSDIDMEVLAELISSSVAHMRKTTS